VTFPWGSLVLSASTGNEISHGRALTSRHFLLINKDKYNQMSDRQKKAVDDNCNHRGLPAASASHGASSKTPVSTR